VPCLEWLIEPYRDCLSLNQLLMQRWTSDRLIPLGYSFLANEPDPTVCCDLRECQRQQAMDYKRLNRGYIKAKHKLSEGSVFTIRSHKFIFCPLFIGIWRAMSSTVTTRATRKVTMTMMTMTPITSKTRVKAINKTAKSIPWSRSCTSVRGPWHKMASPLTCYPVTYIQGRSLKWSNSNSNYQPLEKKISIASSLGVQKSVNLPATWRSMLGKCTECKTTLGVLKPIHVLQFFWLRFLVITDYLFVYKSCSFVRCL